MASFQHDYKKNDVSAISKIYSAWKGSAARLKMVIGKDYYNGDNTTIRTVKRLYYSNGRLTEKIDTTTKAREMVRVGKGWVENKFVSNFRLPYGFFHDVVSQKVNTLLDEAPILQGNGAKLIDKNFVKNLGYALKAAGIYASSQGRGYIFVGSDGLLRVFESENCIPFFDDQTGALRAMYRFWTITDMSEKEYLYLEEYNEDGIKTYDMSKSMPELIKKENYSYRILSDIEGEREEAQNLGYLPICILQNDAEAQSDLKVNVRAKIDAIDIVKSGFANNIEDFADAYWTIKTGNGAADPEELNDFIAAINQTRKVISEGEGADAEPHQFEVPTTARKTFIDDCKTELVQETGVIDTASMTGSSLTTTAIKAATMKLRQRVSDFEWEVYKTAKEILKIFCAYNDIDDSDIDIEFTQLLIQNDTEIIDNAVKVRSDISQESYLSLLQRAGVIDDVEEEIKRLEEESRSSYKIQDSDDDISGILAGITGGAGDGDGQGASGNGQGAGEAGEAAQ